MALSRISRTRAFVAGLSMLVTGALFAAEMTDTRYLFEKEPHVHPKIIEDLTTWESDRGEQVVAINLLESVETNRYFGDIKVSGMKSPFIYYERTEECEESECPMGPPGFGYRLIGKSSSGIFVLFTESSGGGSGRFRNLLFVSVEKDKGLYYDQKNNVLRLNRERWIIKKLGEVILGDRYEGEISIKGDVVHVGKDRYSHSAGFFKKDTALKIDAVR